MNPTKEQMKLLWDNCQKWVAKYEPRCGESLFQIDSVNEALPELAETVCDIVGYYKKKSKAFSNEEKKAILEDFSKNINNQKDIPPSMVITDKGYWDLLDKTT